MIKLSSIILILSFFVFAYGNQQDTLSSGIVTITPEFSDSTFRTGLDVLQSMNFSLLKGKNVAVICNSGSMNSAGKHILDLLSDQNSLRLRKILYTNDENINPNFRFNPGISLGNTRFIPFNPYFIEDSIYSSGGCDLLVYDLISSGLRCDPSVFALTRVLTVCQKSGIPLIILDRPVPIRGDIVEGPVPESKESCDLPWLPLRYGLTTGEVANFILSGQKQSGSSPVTVIKMFAYRRNQWYKSTDSRPTGTEWDKAKILAEEIKRLLNGFNLSVDSSPLLYDLTVNLKWGCEPEIVEILNRKTGEEIEFYPPESLKSGNLTGRGLSSFSMKIKNPDLVRINTLAITLIDLLQRLYPNRNIVSSPEIIWRNFCSGELMDYLDYRLELRSLIPVWENSTIEYLKDREQILIYH